MKTISISYALVWQIQDAKEHKWSKCGKCFNTKLISINFNKNKMRGRNLIFGNIIKSKREDLEIFQSDLANSVGVTQGAISMYEDGKWLPKMDVQIKLCKALELDYVEVIKAINKL